MVAELEQLNQWLNDENSRLWLLAGDGGKGKSAIAYQFALIQRTICKSGNCNLALCKNKTVQCRNPYRNHAPDFWDLGSAVRTGRPKPAAQILTKRTRMEYLLIYQLSSFLTVDSLEGPGISAMNFFHEVLKTPSKILLTSRRIPFGMEPILPEPVSLPRVETVQFHPELPRRCSILTFCNE